MSKYNQRTNYNKPKEVKEVKEVKDVTEVTSKTPAVAAPTNRNEDVATPPSKETPAVVKAPTPEPIEITSPTPATVLTDVYLRKDPSALSDQLMVLLKASDITIVKDVNSEWFEVVASNTKRGYVMKDFVKENA